MTKKKNKPHTNSSLLAPEALTELETPPEFLTYLKSIGKEHISPLEYGDYIEDFLKHFLSGEIQPQIDDFDDTTLDFSRNMLHSHNKTLTAATAKTSDDYFELATQITLPNVRLRYLRKALELDPLNFDATSMLINLKDLSSEDLVKEYGKAYTNAKNLLTKKGFMTTDCIGDYWLILETRPFIRLLHNYIITLINTNRLLDAIDRLKEALIFNTNDNLGLRYDLIHLYVKLQRFDEALALQEKYKDDDCLSMLLPLSILYYTTKNYTKARNLLKKLDLSQDCFDVFNAIDGYGLANAMAELLPTTQPVVYQLNSVEELLITLENYSYLYRDCQSYFEWASRELEKLNKKGKL